MKVLVTGGRGFIGSNLLPLLLATECQVSTLLRNPHSTSARSLPADVEKIYGELPSPQLCEVLCTNVDVVIHLAGLAHVSASEQELQKHNFTASLELAEAARKSGVQKFIFLSSSKARYPAHSAYARIKAETEAALLAMNGAVFEVICLRPGLVYGEGMRGNLAGLLKLLQRKFLPVFPGSRNRIGMIEVKDLARAIILAATKQNLAGRCWELADGHFYSLDEIVVVVRRHLGYKKPLVSLPRYLVKGIAAVAELLSPFYKSSFSMSTYRTIYEEHYEADDAFSRLTGFKAEETFYTSFPSLIKSKRS